MYVLWPVEKGLEEIYGPTLKSCWTMKFPPLNPQNC
jgi:hypothetical protein